MTQKITKTGVVTAIQGRMAIVLTLHEAGCENCSAKSTCSMLGGTGANRQVRARNTVSAQVGDVVTIGIRSSSFLKVSFLVYMVPILALVAGVVVGYFLAGLLSVDENILVGVLGAVGLVCSFLWIKKKADKLAQRPEFVPEIMSRQAPRRTVSHAGQACHEK